MGSTTGAAVCAGCLAAALVWLDPHEALRRSLGDEPAMIASLSTIVPAAVLAAPFGGWSARRTGSGAAPAAAWFAAALAVTGVLAPERIAPFRPSVSPSALLLADAGLVGAAPMLAEPMRSLRKLDAEAAIGLGGLSALVVAAALAGTAVRARRARPEVAGGASDRSAGAGRGGGAPSVSTHR